MVLRKVKVKKVAAFRDGGTIHYVDVNGNSYYKDGRFGSKTPGKIYDRHPNEKDAKGLNVNLVEVTDFLNGIATIA